MNLADYRSYVDCQDRVGKAYADQEQWTVKSMMNTAHMGYFSSDRAVMEYAEKIWSCLRPSDFKKDREWTQIPVFEVSC